MVAIVIVNWNSGPLLERCVRSLREYASDSRIIVIDNASADASADFINASHPSVKLIRNTRNAGFAAACNQGWQADTAELVLFLNPDTESLVGGVETLVQRMEGDPAVWAVGGRLLSPGGISQAGFNLRSFPDIGAVAAEMLLLDEIWPRNPWTRRYRMADLDPDTSCYVDQPAAACLMVRRAVLQSIGGFDEIFHPAWFEDVDLCKRIRAAGGRIVYEPAALFVHHGAVSLRNLTLEMFLRSYHGNQIRYFAKHHGRMAARRVRRLVAAGLYIRAVSMSLRNPFHLRSADRPARTYWRAARHFARMREAGA